MATASRLIWTHPDWPQLRVEASALAGALAQARRAQGIVIGKSRAIGFEAIGDALESIWVDEALATARIEGEQLDLIAVRSSVARRLGLTGRPHRSNRNAEGLLDVMQDAIAARSAKLTRQRLFDWHAAMFPMGRSGLHRIRVGAWRGKPMQIVSGPIGREKVHYEAPPAARVAAEMRAWLTWFEFSRKSGLDGLVRAALAHLWFETIHPFEDGNGRLGRALIDLALAQDSGESSRLFRMSWRLANVRADYYTELEHAQHGTMDVTRWVSWFVEQFREACVDSERTIDASLLKARYWHRHQAAAISARQRKALNVLLDAGPGGFTGGMSTSKYAHLTSASRATASRELVDLVDKGLLVATGQLKGTRYHIALEGWVPKPMR